MHATSACESLVYTVGRQFKDYNLKLFKMFPTTRNTMEVQKTES